MRRLAAALLFALPLTACASHHEAVDRAFATTTATHRTVAILPFDVNIAPDGLPRNATPEHRAAIEHEEGRVLQAQLYRQLLQRSSQFSVQFQDIAQTNAQLEGTGRSLDELYMRKEEIARLLGVDAIITARIDRSKPMDGVTVAMSLLFGPPIGGIKPTNEVVVDMVMHDARNGDLLWTFHDDLGGSIGSTPERLASALVTSIARRFPYRRTAS
jgi:hypothetical protein